MFLNMVNVNYGVRTVDALSVQPFRPHVHECQPRRRVRIVSVMQVLMSFRVRESFALSRKNRWTSRFLFKIDNHLASQEKGESDYVGSAAQAEGTDSVVLTQ